MKTVSLCRCLATANPRPSSHLYLFPATKTAKQKILKMQSTLEVWKMKANDVGELKRSVASEKNRANLLQAELRTPRNKKLDKVLENSNKQDRDSKMSHMKALTSLQVALQSRTATSWSSRPNRSRCSSATGRRDLLASTSMIHIISPTSCSNTDHLWACNLLGSSSQ